MTARYAYFNCAAVAPLSTRARNAMRRLVEDQAKHGSIHDASWFATYDSCRARAARLIGASADEIALVPNTSAGLSTVAHGLSVREGDNVVVPDREFPANVYPWMALPGVEVRRVPKRDGRLLPEDVAAHVDGRTVAVSVSFVDWISGQRVDLAAVGAAAHEHGALFVVDAIQGLGALRLDVDEAGIDALAADGHKWLCGPEGAGILYVRRAARERIAPTRPSWLSVRHPTRFLDYDLAPASDARRYQDGTPNTCGVYGLDAALELVLELGLEAVEERMLELAALVREGAAARGVPSLCPEGGSGIVGLLVDDPATFAAALQGRGVVASARGEVLRVAVHHYNDESDVGRLLDCF